MFDAIDQIGSWLPLYLLVFSRISGMLVSMPVLGYATVSVRIRIILGLLLTLIISPLLSGGYHLSHPTPLALMVDVLREVFIGLLIGYGARLIFEGFSIAGQFIGLQMGMAIMQVFDPSNQNNQPIISSFWMLIIVVFFIVSNSHHFLIRILFFNFKAIGLGMAAIKPMAGQQLISGGTLMFELALKFGAPVMIFLLVVDLAIAFMARVMPQLNIFFISLPLKIGTGIFLLMISLQIFQSLFSYVMNGLETFVTGMIRGI